MATYNLGYILSYIFKQQNNSFVLGKKIAAQTLAIRWWKYTPQIHEAFYGIVSALSVHQLAAQGEMLYLATRIEQGNSLFFKMYLSKFKVQR